MASASEFSLKVRFREFAGIPEVVILSLSGVLFIAFLVANLPDVRFDEKHYSGLAKVLWEQGPFVLTDLHAQRTYLYPLLLSVFWPVVGGDLEILRVVMALFQYAVLVATVVYLALGIGETETSRVALARRAVLVAGLWNPYLVQATTLLLTDSLAACGFAFAVAATWRSNLDRWPGVLASVGVAACAGMLRPAALPALGLVLGSIVLRGWVRQDVQWLRCGVRCLVGLAPLLPQIVLNVRNFNRWSVLPDIPMYGIQMHWAAYRLRWVTSTDPRELGGIKYINPVPLEPNESIYSAVFDAPLAFAVAYGSHLFHLLDWGYVDIFVDDLYAPSRIVGSVFVYSTWGLVLLGVFERLWRGRTGLIGDGGWLVLACSSVAYGAFIATTQMETRYAYPVLLLALPFVGPGTVALARYGAAWIAEERFGQIAVLSVAYAVAVVGLLVLSLSLDLTSGRIDWFGYYLG